MEKLLTVSIAAYNVETYIEEALISFLKVNKPERLEILIIDDGATDNTYSIAQNFSSRYPDVFKVIHKVNGGWGSTVTTGIKNASGKYFKLLDGDDYFNSENLSYFLDELENTEADAIFTPYIKFYDGTDKIEHSYNDFFEVKNTRKVEFSEIPVNPFCLEMYALTFRTALLQNADVSITEHCFYTDNEYVVKGVSLCKSALIMPYSLYCYRLARPGQSVSIEGMKKHYKEYEYILKSMLIYVRENVVEPSLKNIFFERYRGLSYYYYELLMSFGNNPQYKDDIIKYDRWLKNEFKFIYKNIKYRPIQVLRFTGYRFWALARMLSVG